MMDKLNYIREQVEQKVGYPLNINSRKRDVVYARSIYFALARDMRSERFTLEAIGDSIGKDHSTVIHSLNTTYNQAMRTDFYSEIYETIKEDNSKLFLNPSVRRGKSRNTREYVNALKDQIEALHKENSSLRTTNRQLRKNTGNDEFAMLTFDLTREQLAEVMERVKLMCRMMPKEVNA
jgi:regulator of replication initiation timing